jgi:hypothetical protein
MGLNVRSSLYMVLRMLIATLLALLGIPIWLLLGAVAGALFSRHNFRAQPDVVPMMHRATGDEKWPRGPGYGRYVNNVLVINHGLALIRTSVHVVEHMGSLDLGDTTFKHIDDPIGYAIRVDDGSAHELAIARADNPIPVPAEQ